MTRSNDSQVVSALQTGNNLERVLRELGCDTRKDNGAEFESASGFIHCPMPGHPDVHESVTVRASQGLMYCQSSCGEIMPLDLIVEHGAAANRGEAAKWVEQLLQLRPAPIVHADPLVDDPSMTVATYLALKGLPQSTVELFGLTDVSTWHPGADKNVRGAAYESGWYDSVLMPNRADRRGRIRSEWPRTKVRWATKARFDGSGITEDLSLAPAGGASPGAVLEMDALGVAQLVPSQSCTGLAARGPLLLVVEGESDVHAMHAMGLPFTVGVPGSKMADKVARALLDACIKANYGDVDLSSLTAIVWQEPGEGGSGFPAGVARAIEREAGAAGFIPPRFAALAHGAVAGQPKDPAALLLDRGAAQAGEILLTSMLGAAEHASVAAVVSAPAPALNPEAQRRMAEFVADRALPLRPTSDLDLSELDAEPAPADPWADRPAPPATVPSSNAPGYTEHAQVVAAGPLWSSFENSENPPQVETAPELIEGIADKFIRTEEGWSILRVVKGEQDLKAICTPFVVEAVESCGDQILIRVAAPFGGFWNRSRISLSEATDAGVVGKTLGAIGVRSVNRSKSGLADLLQSMATRRELTAGVQQVPRGTGWSGAAGTSLFGGIEVEPIDSFAARMFQANQERRKLQPDTAAAALTWYRDAAAPLLDQDGPNAGAAGQCAPMLVFGAAAAGPLMGPLAAVGLSITPIVWLAGLGGGGKSVTQKVCNGIFAPVLPDIDGQAAFSASANISQAALSARVDSCRDLPLVLDDVTQLPALATSQSKGDAARIEAGAALAMLVFNRKPIERATRDGELRLSKPFRSSAIFSAEVSMASESTKAVLTAGHRRRVTTIEAQPMNDRGLGAKFAERVDRINATVGGAPGELLVARIREVVAAQQLRPAYEEARRFIAEQPSAHLVTSTQQEAMAVSVLGFGLLMEAISAYQDATHAMREAARWLEPYMATGAGEGGAIRDADLSGVLRAQQSIDDLRAAHPTRFDRHVDHGELQGLMMPVPTNGYLGREMRSLRNGTRRVVMLRAGMELLERTYGVTSGVIEQASKDGACRPRYQVRMSDDTRPYGMLWNLPPHQAEELEIDTTVDPHAHDADPMGLAKEDEMPYVMPTPLDTQGQAMDAVIAQLRDGRARACNSCNLVWESEPAVTGAMCSDPLCTGWATKHASVMLADQLQTASTPHDSITTLPSRPPVGEAQFTEIHFDEGGTLMDGRFNWATGNYVVTNEAMISNQSLHSTIRKDVAQELRSLAELYDTDATPAEIRIPVRPMPANDDPNWSHIDAIGESAARTVWPVSVEANRVAAAIDEPIERNQAHADFVKNYRIHLMARHRHPEWFIVVGDA